MMTESERVDRFEAAYNRIDRALAEFLKGDKNRRRHGFAAKVRILSNRQKRYARYADFLLEIGELRNAIVHNRTNDEIYLAVPHEKTVIDLEAIEQRMLAPERVVPRFQKVVLTLSPEETLAQMWERMRDHGHPRYPVYAPEGFIGLLTTNGIARFCASQAKAGQLNFDTTTVSVADVLEVEPRRDRVAFVSREALIDDVDDMFSTRNPLEAVLITEHGRPHEKPIGIICAADIAALAD